MIEMAMHQYKVTLTIKNHSIKPKKIYKYKTLWDIGQAWEFAREVCREYNKNHKTIAVITGVGKN
jgi:hypothetical protein